MGRISIADCRAVDQSRRFSPPTRLVAAAAAAAAAAVQSIDRDAAGTLRSRVAERHPGDGRLLPITLGRRLEPSGALTGD